MKKDPIDSVLQKNMEKNKENLTNLIILLRGVFYPA